MLFLTDLQRRRVVDSSGTLIGRVTDVSVVTGDLFPVVTAIIVEGPAGRVLVHTENVDELDASPLRLRTSSLEPDTEPMPGEFRLVRDVLDHQVLDTRGRRMVKINDIQLNVSHGVPRLVAADVGARGYLRRLGLERFVDMFRLPIKDELITWNNVSSTGGDLRLNVTQTGMVRLHPADIADLIDQLDSAEGAALLGTLDDITAAETLSELDPDRQEDFLERMGTERGADLLEAMDADDAADILGELSNDQAEALLAGMNQEDADEVRGLLRYDDESAGGIMSPDLIAIQEDLSADEAISRLRALSPDAEVAYYLYVVDNDQRLRGVVSLRDLITAASYTQIASIMNTDVTRVTVGTDQEEAARLIAKYDLLALPVVDEDGRLVGIITVDDIIDVIQQEADEDLAAVAGASVGDMDGTSGVISAALGRLRWLAVSLFVGLGIAAVLRSVAADTSISVVFVPLILFLTGQAVGQSLAVVTRGIGLGLRDDLTVHEAQVTVISAVVIGILSGGGAALVAGGMTMGWAVGGSVALGVLLSGLVGTAAPIIANRLTSRPLVLGQPLFGPVIGAVSLLIYLGFNGFLQA